MTHPFQDSWHPVSLSKGLHAGRAERAVVRGIDLAIWRGADGKARAWENRCPHRGMRLSFGFVRENRLTCLYHGWGYDGDGACVSIPAHPGLTPPKTIKVSRYQCHEAGGLIWVAQEAAVEPAPEVLGEWIACQTLKFDCSIDDAETALLKHRSALQMGTEDGSVAADSAPVVKLNEALLQIVLAPGVEALCALQPIDEFTTAVHLLVSASEATGDVAPEQRCARWGRHVRRQIDAQPTRSSAFPISETQLAVAS